MGSFVGHIDEAIFFLLLAFWWMIRIFPLYIKSRAMGKRFKVQLSYRLPCQRAIPLESLLKLLMPIGGVIGELFSEGFALVGEDGRFRKMAGMQHMSIYCMFILHSSLDLLTTLRFPVPPNFDYISAAFSFFWYGLSFSYHSHMGGKMPLENTIHQLPICIMYLTAICILLEMIFPFLFELVLMRIACLIILGTWFTQAAFVLYLPFPLPGSALNPSWDQSDPHNTHALIASFGFHIIFAIIIITTTYSTLHYFTKHFIHQQFEPIKSQDDGDDEENEITSLTKRSAGNGRTFDPLDIDENDII